MLVFKGFQRGQGQRGTVSGQKPDQAGACRLAGAEKAGGADGSLAQFTGCVHGG